MKDAIYMLNGGEDWHVDDLLNSFIITSKSGAVVVIDGGHEFNAKHLLERLKEITGEDKPHIDGWFLTHLHEDHINAFLEIVENQPDAVDVDKVYYNMITDIAIQIKEGQNCVKTFLNFYRLLPLFKEKSYVPVVGETLWIKNLKFEILHTAGAQLRANDCNNNSLVFKMTIGDKTVMFLADAGVEAGNKLLERWGHTGILKSDICQMAHHGQCGVDKPVYQAISPKICLWNTPKYLWNNDLGKGYNTFTFKTIEVQNWMKELGVEKHYVIKDGDQICEL